MESQDKQPLIFIGGVHGVGKSVFASSLANKFSAQHVIASSLIRRHLTLAQNKLVADVKSNQGILVEALAILGRSAETLLLDGHFCLLNKQSEIENVSLDTFKRINPKGLILISGEPSVIQERLKKRDGVSPELSLISRFQEEEVSWAKIVAETLRVPLVNLFAPTESEINNQEIKVMFEE